jgi:hypothetical protein
LSLTIVFIFLELSLTIVVMPGLVPGIHVFLSNRQAFKQASRGWPGQARP